MDEKLSVAEQLLYTTVRIETQDDAGVASVATGFILSVTLEEKRYLFLVTNRHVASGAATATLAFTLGKDGQAVVGRGYKLAIDEFEGIWTLHPDERIDVAVAPFVPFLKHLSEQHVEIFFRSIDSNLIPDAEALKQLDAIEDVVFVGYPNGIWDDVNNLPVIRKGITATPINVDFRGLRQFLIDASVFPGSSGSPVFIYDRGMYAPKGGGTVVGTRLHFLGVVASVFVREDKGRIIMVAEPTDKSPTLVSRQMLDLGVVFKAEAIIDVANLIIEGSPRP